MKRARDRKLCVFAVDNLSVGNKARKVIGRDTPCGDHATGLVYMLAASITTSGAEVDWVTSIA